MLGGDEAVQDTPDEDYDFMSSWGDAGTTLNFGDDEPDPEPEPAPVIDIAPQPKPETVLLSPTPQYAEPATRITDTEPQEEAPSRLWSIISQVLLGLLLAVGVLSLLRLHQVTDAVTAARLYGGTAPAPITQPYDYSVDLVHDADIAAHMRLMGIEGWKVVGSRRLQDQATGQYGYEFIFMRARPNR